MPKTAPQSDGCEPRRALITGGAGFIGSHLCDELLASGVRVVVVDNLSTGRLENLPCGAAEGAVPRLRVIVDDLRAAIPILERDEPPFDEIYHLAAAVGVQRIIERPIESIESNVRDTAELLAFASSQFSSHTHGARTLVASSSEVYGKGAGDVFQEDGDCVYGPTTKLRWSYACSKAIDEYLALAHHAEHGLPVVICRFFNIVGPRQVGDYGMVLPRMIAKVLAGQPPQVYGGGQQTRCFCDVRTMAPMLTKLVRRKSCHGRVFNVGSDQPISILELARQVVRTLAPEQADKLAPQFVPYDRAYGAGFEDLRQRKPDLSRLCAELNVDPGIDLPATIRDIAEHLRIEADRVPGGAHQPT